MPTHDADHKMHSHLKTYLVVFAALMGLLVVTVAVAAVDLEPYSFELAITIAVIKAVLVILFFMHVIERTSLTWMFASAGFFWLGILFVLTFNDYMTRTWLLNDNQKPAISIRPLDEQPAPAVE